MGSRLSNCVRGWVKKEREGGKEGGNAWEQARKNGAHKKGVSSRIGRARPYVAQWLLVEV